MDQKWILPLVILLVYQQMTSGAGTVKVVPEGEDVDIGCAPKTIGTMVIWFRILDNAGMEFIASFTNNGILKSPPSLPSTFKPGTSNKQVLTLKNFKENRDTGIYGCASFTGGNSLSFGDATRLDAKKAPTAAPKAITTQPTQVDVPTTTPCACTGKNNRAEINPSMSCPLIILAPLAGGCALLLLLLIIITLYCNKIRTRRCPHHYKRKPRMVAPGKQVRNVHI